MKFALMAIFILMWTNFSSAGIFSSKFETSSSVQKRSQIRYSVDINEFNSLIITNIESSEAEASLSLNDYKHEDHNESYVSEIVYSADQNSFAVILGFSEIGERNPYKFGFKETREAPIQLCLVASLDSEKLGEISKLISLEPVLHEITHLSGKKISFSSPYTQIDDFSVDLND